MAIVSSCFTALCASIWYGFLIATLSFFSVKKIALSLSGSELESRYFLRSTGHSRARSVTCIDGFVPKHNDEHNARLYGTIYDSFTDEEKDRVRDIVTRHRDGTVTLGGARLISRYGVPVDVDQAPLESGRYDIIVSRAVLEHFADLDTGWRTMVRCLSPSGEMWHKVDFRCHKLFGELHPLYFLTIPEPVWNLISRPDPTLNRRRLPSYRELAARDFQQCRIFISHILEEAEILPHVEKLVPGQHYLPRHVESIQELRPRLQPPFSSYSDEDLLVNGIFLIARGRS